MKAVPAITRVAMACNKIACVLIPRISPNKTRTISPVNVVDRETITTPNANMPTNNNPMAVSDDNRDFRVIRLIPPIIITAPSDAPMIPGRPNKIATAIPGNTPCARASPINARPRKTIKVPTIQQVIETRIPASKARNKKVFDKKGSINKFITSLNNFGLSGGEIIRV